MSLARAQEEAAHVQSRVRDLEAQIEAARKRLADLDAYIRLAQEFGEASQKATDAQPKVASDARAPVRVRTRPLGVDGSRADRARALAIEYVRAAGHPVTARELVTELAKHGLTFGGGDPKRDTSDLSAALRQAPELKVRRNVGWSLAEWEYEAETQADTEAETDTIPGNNLL